MPIFGYRSRKRITNRRHHEMPQFRTYQETVRSGYGTPLVSSSDLPPREEEKRGQMEDLSGGGSQGSFYLKQKHYAILNSAGIQVNPFTRRNSAEQKRVRAMLQKGIYLDDNKMRYKVTDTGKDYFALYAKMLRITGSDDPSCWKWYQDQEGTGHEVAESVDVKWLQVRGMFSTANLDQNTLYQVSFKVKVTKSELLGIRLFVKLVLPDGSKQENPIDLKDLRLNEWKDLMVGTFQTSYNTVGNLDVSLEQLDSSWKRGLAIQCVKIVATK